MTKNQKKKLLISGSILTTSIFSIGSIIGLQYYNNSVKNQDTPNLFSQNNSINSRSLIWEDVEWGQLVNTDSSISLPDSIKINSQSPNAHVAVPGGIVLSTNKGICFLNQNTLKIDWTIDSIGNTNQTTIFSSIYFNNKVYTLHMYDGGMRVTEIDPTNGTITKQSKKLTCNRASNNDFSYVLLPVQGTNDSIFIMPRGLMKNSERNASTYQFWINKNFDASDNFLNVNFEEDSGLANSETKIIYSAGAFYTSSYGTFVARLERYSTSKRIFLRVYKISSSRDANLWQELKLENSTSITEDDYTDVTNHVAQIKINNNGGALEMQFISNHNSGSDSKVYVISWSFSSSSSSNPSVNTVVNLNKTNQDYDIEWGYYNSQIDRFCVLVTHTNASEASFVLINSNNLANDGNFASSNKKNINIFKPGSGDLFKNWNRKTGMFIPILTYGSGINSSDSSLTGDQNFFVFNDLDVSNSKYIVYNGSPENNDQTEYPYAYRSRFITNPEFSGLSDINLRDITDNINDEYVLSLFDERKDFIIENCTKFSREDTYWTINGVKTPTNEHIYQGKIYFDKITFWNFYLKGKLQGVYWENQFVGGFYVWNTTQLKTSIASDQQLKDELNDPNHDNDSVYKDFIFKNKEQLFSDIPLESDFSLDNIIIKEYDNSNSNEMTIQFALNSHIVDGVLKSEEASFTLTITDVPNISTEQKITSIEADASLNVYTPQQIANDIGTSSNLITTLTEFISNNKNEIFDNIPDDATFAIDNDSQSSNIYGEVIEITNNSIKFKFSVRNTWINGVKETGWNDKTIKNFEITLTGLTTQEATKAKENAQIESGLNDILPVDWIANNSITQYLLDNLDKVFDNLPNKITNNGTALLVSVDNIQIVGDPIPNNLDGTVTVTIKLNKYFDEQGMLYDGGSNFDNALEHTIKIVGFKSRKPTTIASDRIAVENVSNIDATNWTEDVVKFIFDNKDTIFTNLTENFVQTNIKKISQNPNNINGEIVVEFYLDTYIDQDGNLVTSGDENGFKQSITLTGFKLQKPTLVISNRIYVEGVSDIDASNWNEDVVQYIFDNKDTIFTNLPENFAQTNIIKVSQAPNNINGEIVVEFYLDTYIDQDGNLVTGGDENGFKQSITLTGFKNQQPTTLLDSEVIIILLNDKYLSDFYQGNADVFKQLIIDSKANIFNNIGQLTLDDLTSVTITSSEINNKTGEITIKFVLNKNYYNDSGELVTSATDKEFGPLTIKGFKKLTDDETTTTLANPTALEGVNTILSADWKANEEAIKQAIISKIQNVVPGQTITADDLTLSLSNNFSPSNKEDKLILDITISNSKAMENGIVKETFTLTDITFTGFKNQQPTTIASNRIAVENVSNIDATNWTEDVVKFIFDNKDTIFTNLPENFVQTNIKKISQTPNNINGEIVVEFYLDTYIDQDGNLVTSGDENGFKQSITLTGFKNQQPTTLVNSEITINSLNNQYLSDFYQGNADVFKQLIIDNKTNIFNNIGELAIADFTSVTVTSTEINNKTGEITIKFTLNKNYYNDSGELVTSATDKEFGPLTIKGFKTLTDDEATTTLANPTALEGVNTILPADWKANEEVIKQAIISKIQNVVPGQTITADDLTLSLSNNFSPSNKEDKLILDITISNSKAMENGIVKETFTLTEITFTGFKFDNSQDLNKDNLKKWISIVLIFTGGIVLLIISIFLMVKYFRERN